MHLGIMFLLVVGFALEAPRASAQAPLPRLLNYLAIGRSEGATRCWRRRARAKTTSIW